MSWLLTSPRRLTFGRSALALALAALALAAARPAAAQAPAAADPAPAASTDARIRDLERQLAELRQKLAETQQAGQAAAAEAARLEELSRQLQVLAQEVERLKIGEAAAPAPAGMGPMGPAASKVYRTERGLSIGGYGELLYRHKSDRGEAEASVSRGKEEEEEGEEGGNRLDLQRAVLYFGYKWNDHFLFNSEVEYEHGGKEVGVEFAYLDYLWRPQANFRAGLLLLPMGFLNELHEPTVFLSADRPDTEQLLLPTTWTENGFGLFGQSGPWSYRTYVVDGFDATGFSEKGLRGGRQEGKLAKADSFAWVGRLDYNPLPGLVIGGSAYVGDAGQDLETPEGRALGVRTKIAEGHLEWKWRGLSLRALGAQARVADVAALDAALGLTGDASVGERLQGYYLEAGYDVLAGSAGNGGERSLTPFARYERVDTQERVPAGFVADPANDFHSLTLGVAYKPIEQLVFKLDHQRVDTEAGTGSNRFHALLGYIF
jgi:hypothetical protein